MATNNAIDQIGILPSFFATNNADQLNVTGDGTVYHVLFNTESYDKTSSYDTATSVFTAPLTGKYSFTASLFCSDMSPTNSGVTLALVTTGKQYWLTSINVFGNGGNLKSGSVIVPLTAGNTAYVTFTVGGGGKTCDVLASASAGGAITPIFSGYMISGI